VRYLDIAFVRFDLEDKSHLALIAFLIYIGLIYFGVV
jgi:hypothetical protein